jgi:hypothetical protein
MPYKVKKVKGGYKVAKKSTGKTGYSKKPQTKEKATAQMRAMYMSEHNMDRKDRM